LHSWRTSEVLDRHDQCLTFEVVDPVTNIGKVRFKRNNGLIISDASWRSTLTAHSWSTT
jgi:hypothetical protein